MSSSEMEELKKKGEANYQSVLQKLQNELGEDDSNCAKELVRLLNSTYNPQNIEDAKNALIRYAAIKFRDAQEDAYKWRTVWTSRVRNAKALERTIEYLYDALAKCRRYDIAQFMANFFVAWQKLPEKFDVVKPQIDKIQVLLYLEIIIDDAESKIMESSVWAPNCCQAAESMCAFYRKKWIDLFKPYFPLSDWKDEMATRPEEAWEEARTSCCPRRRPFEDLESPHWFLPSTPYEQGNQETKEMPNAALPPN